MLTSASSSEMPSRPHTLTSLPMNMLFNKTRDREELESSGKERKHVKPDDNGEDELNRAEASRDDTSCHETRRDEKS